MRRNVLLGSFLVALILASSVTMAAATCAADPDSLNFGFTVVGVPVPESFVLTNDTGAPMAGSLAFQGDHPNDFTFTVGGGAFVYALEDGESVVVEIIFMPTALGVRTASLALGALATDCGRTSIPCCGYGTETEPPAGARSSTSPTNHIEFPNTVVGESSSELLIIWFSEGEYFEYAIPTSIGDFDLDHGGFHLLSDHLSGYVHFRPTTPGRHEESLERPIIPLVEQGPPLKLFGLALAEGVACEVTNADLDLGIVPVGGTKQGVVRILNIGTEYITMTLPGNCGPFRIVDGPRFCDLHSGEIENIVVEFMPQEPGPVSCVLDVDQVACEQITLSGMGYENPGTTDQIGVWFERTGTTNRMGTTTPYEEVTAYLMIANPSIPVGASGWECCVEVDGDVVGLEWVVEGDGLNTETSPCFRWVDRPGPWGGVHPSGYGHVLPVDPDMPTSFYIHPIDTPSLPGTALRERVGSVQLIPWLPRPGWIGSRGDRQRADDRCRARGDADDPEPRSAQSLQPLHGHHLHHGRGGTGAT